MKKLSLPGVLSLSVLLAFGLFYAFDPQFRDWLSKAYEAFSTGKVDEMRSFLAAYKQWGYLILLGAFLFQMFLFVVPSVLVMTVSIIMYGPIEGSLICLGGIFIASTVAFFLGKSLSEVTLDKLIGKSSRQKMTDYLENYGFWTVLIFRLSPFLSNDAVSFVAGLVKMKYWRFIAATMAGITPLTAMIAYFGRKTSAMDTGLIVISAVGLVGLGVYIYIDRRKKKKEKTAK